MARPKGALKKLCIDVYPPSARLMLQWLNEAEGKMVDVRGNYRGFNEDSTDRIQCLIDDLRRGLQECSSTCSPQKQDGDLPLNFHPLPAAQ